MSIHVENITKYYGEQAALKGVNFAVSAGELVGFLGPNGAGKSTLMKFITGYLPADSGSVYIHGEKAGSGNYSIRTQTGYLPEHNPLYTELYVKEYLSMVAGFYPVTNKRLRVAEMIEMTGLQDEQHKKIGALSKGYRQRVGLAQALIHDPSVLILDEPTTGLDPNQLEDIRQLIRTIAREKTVMLSTHIMQEVEAVCSRVLIIDKGELVADGTVNDLKTGRFTSGQQVFAEFSSEPDFAAMESLPWIRRIQIQSARAVLVESAVPDDIRPRLFDWAVRNQLVLLTLSEQHQSLEKVFHRVTRERQNKS